MSENVKYASIVDNDLKLIVNIINLIYNLTQ